MSFQLSSIEDALKVQPDQECSIAVKILEMGDVITYHNSQKQERKYFIIKAADNKDVINIRNYQVRNRVTLNAGVSYAFLGLLRKMGDECFWTTKNTNIVEWVPVEVPDNIHLTPVKSPNNSPRKLSEAIQSGSTSLIKGKVVQSSPKDYRRNGTLAIKFVSLRDTEDEPAVKIALFGEDAEMDYRMGDVISITNTYQYNKTNSLSTKESSKIEFHPPDSVPVEVSLSDYLEDEDFTKKYTPPVTTEFTAYAVKSCSLYVCCPNPTCRNKKMIDDVCSKCKGTCLLKKSYYCTADIIVARGKDLSQHTLFYPDLKKLIPSLPDLNSFNGSSSDLTAHVRKELPVNGHGSFCNNNLKIVSAKRKSLPEMV